MKIATYNVAHRNTDLCWSQLVQWYDPDLIVAQESRPPKSQFLDVESKAPCVDQLVWQKVQEGSNWGAAISTKHGSLAKTECPGCEDWMTGVQTC